MSGLGDAVPALDGNQQVASNGMVITIGDDGEVYFDHAAPAVHTKQDDTKFEQNLAETLEDGVLTDIANDYIDGVNADIQSRQDFIQNHNKGVDLLGLKLDEASSTRGNRQSISRIKNPSLLKACMRSQSNSRGQLLPAQGPAKIQTISGESGSEDDLAKNFEQDFNYFLTEVDRGFYPDTDRMLFYRAFGGSAYKKVYRDPILRRPTSRFTSLDSLIVSEDATDLTDALRKTNELNYSPVQVQRMMKAGGWLDISLGQPMQNMSPARRKILESQGLSAVSTRSQDISHTIYEGYWYFDSQDYGFDDRKADPGMPAPYKVVIDRDSRKVLALHRNWKPGDDMFRERQVFVKYGLVPGLGFLDYGFLHLIGNQTRVLTAIWQILVDKGMLSNFPGGMKAKGIRTATNEINPSLGEWVEVDLGSMDDIRKALMAMPYGEISQTFVQFAEIIAKDIDSLSGTLEIPTGQGTTNTPVGTILAIIEQQAQDLTAVQQRDHRAQKDELRLIRDLFLANPDDLRHLQRKGSQRNWKDLQEEFSDMDLVPASDPNVPSQAHRILINQFIVSLAEKAPQLFGSRLQKVGSRVLRSIGVNDADDLLAPKEEFLQWIKNAQQGGGKGGNAGGAALAKTQLELPLKQAGLKIEEEKLGILKQDTQRKAAKEAQQGELDKAETQAQILKTTHEIQHDRNTLASDHGLGMAQIAAGSPQADPQAQAELERTHAQTLAAVGSGVLSLSKAGETAAQGKRDMQDFEDGTENGRDVPEPAPQAPASAPLKKKRAKRKSESGKGSK